MTLDSFKYDPFGRRIYKSSSSGTSVFAYDGDNLVEETNATEVCPPAQPVVAEAERAAAGGRRGREP